MSATADVSPAPPGKLCALALLCLAEIAVLSLWFVSAAILPEMAAEGEFSAERGAALSTAVQLGFVTGAVLIAVLGLADRFDPRTVICISAAIAAAANAALLITPLGGWLQVALRAVTGACMAGVYPVGMKIAVGWGLRDRGFLVGLLVGAITLGSGAPHLLALSGGADWRWTVSAASLLAAVGAGLALLVHLGPHHARASAFDPGAVILAWTNRRARLAVAGYLGHMWELYAFWAWVAAAASASYLGQLGDASDEAARLTAFAAITVGGLMCVPAGRLADRVGKARVAQWAMIISGLSALATALSFGGPVWLTAACMLAWGASIVPDSAQFSALVADAVPANRAGSLLTFQTALGFALTAVTVQLVPAVVAIVDWPLTLALLAIGPALGVEAMRRLIRLTQDP